MSVGDAQRRTSTRVPESVAGHIQSGPGGEHHDAARIAADLRIRVVPFLNRRVLLDRQTAESDVVGQQGQRTRVLSDLDRVLAGVDADHIAGAPVRLGVEPGPIVPGLLHGDRVTVIDVEGRIRDFRSRGDLGQRLAVDEDLLGVGRHALGGRIGIGGAHGAEADHVRGGRPCPGAPAAP